MTPKQRARKIETAAIHLASSLRDIDAVIADISGNSPFLTADERAIWAALARVAGRIEAERDSLAEVAR